MKLKDEKQPKEERKALKDYLKAIGIKDKDVNDYLGVEEDAELTRGEVLERMQAMHTNFTKLSGAIL